MVCIEVLTSEWYLVGRLLGQMGAACGSIQVAQKKKCRQHANPSDPLTQDTMTNIEGSASEMTSIEGSTSEMTSIDEAVARPLQLLARCSHDTAVFRALFPLEAGIPRLTALSETHGLVQWDCFVQDNALGFQVYPRSAVATNQLTGQQTTLSLAYMDAPAPPWYLDTQDYSQLHFDEKHLHVCISVPGAHSLQPDIADTLAQLAMAKDAVSIEHYKQAKTPTRANNLVVAVKTYGAERLALNQHVRIVGVFEQSIGMPADVQSMYFRCNLSEIGAMHDFLPTLHCLYSVPLTPAHLLPCLARELQYSPSGIILLISAPEISLLRTKAIAFISTAISGDLLAAEYIYLQLFSKMYSLY